MGNPAVRAERERQRKWAARARQQTIDAIDMYTIPTHFRIRVLRFALYAEGVVSMLTPHSVYLSHMLVREHMRSVMYGQPTGGALNAGVQ